MHTENTKSHLNNRICQHCSVKTSTVTPSFYYVFNISLSCNINIPSFIGNLWWVLLLGNHLKQYNSSYCKLRPPVFLVTQGCFPKKPFIFEIYVEFGSWFTNSSRVLRTSRVVYQLLYNNQINARALIRRIRKPLACGSWFTNSSRVLPTSRVVYQLITHRNLWFIA